MQRIFFISYCEENSRFFRAVIRQLPSSITGIIYSVRKRHISRLISTCWPPSNKAILSPDTLSKITDYDIKLARLLHPHNNHPYVEAHLRNRARQWFSFFRCVLHKADMVVVYNGFPIPCASAIAAAKSLGINVAFCELGVLPGTIAIDSSGINYESQIRHMTPEILRDLPIDPDKYSLLLQQHFAQRQLRKSSQDPMAGCHDGQPLPERFLLFAMQVHDDTQILSYSPRFQTMDSTICYLAEQLRCYREQYGVPMHLVVKEHPSDFGRVDYSALRASLPDVIFLRTTPVREIISQATAVVTINSSVGIEGLFYGKPVITLGNALYNIPSIVYHLGNNEEFVDLLPSVLSSPTDRDLAMRFIYYLRYHYLVPGDYWNPDEETAKAVGKRLQELFAVSSSSSPSISKAGVHQRTCQ